MGQATGRFSPIDPPHLFVPMCSLSSFRADSRSLEWEPVDLGVPEGTCESFDSRVFGVAPLADLWRDFDFYLFQKVSLITQTRYPSKFLSFCFINSQLSLKTYFFLLASGFFISLTRNNEKEVKKNQNPK